MGTSAGVEVEGLSDVPLVIDDVVERVDPDGFHSTNSMALAAMFWMGLSGCLVL